MQPGNRIGNRILTSWMPRRVRNSIDRALDSVLEPLEPRWMLAVTATSAGGVLSIVGDDGANAITVSRDAAGNLLVNGGAVPIAGSPATVTDTQTIQISGLGGNDALLLDETNGALPKASLSGGVGNDTLSGGAGADTLDGGEGNDALLGKGGNDQLTGGGGKDTLTGGAGADGAFGGSGNDRMIWNPGDGSDVNEGGEGTDTVEVNGGEAAEDFAAEGVGTRVLFRRIDPLPFTIDIGGSERLVLNAGGGGDSFLGGTGLAGLTAFTINGNAGDDTLVGTDGADTMTGGDGDDFLDGNAGADVALMGSGDDVFRWDGGDGSDVVEGQAGTDLLLFNGADVAEKVELSARKGGRLRFFRDVGNVTMDVNETEDVRFNALGGADGITVRSLRGTDVREVDLNLLASAGGGDGQADDVIVEGGSEGDVITVSGTAGGVVSAKGLSAAVNVRGAEATDGLAVDSLGGRDVLIASGLEAGAIRFAANGGTGDDVLVGGGGNETLTGSAGADVLIGSAGKDLLDGGPGEDILVQ